MFCFRRESSWPKDFVPVLILCGLDNAGKSTIVCRLCADSSEPIPTVGFVPHTIKFGHKSLRLYDVGGGERIRGIWSSYFAEVYGVIYVIDSTDVSRLPETIEVYKSLCEDSLLFKKPILVLANKQDGNGAMNLEQVEAKLLENVSRQNTMITETSAIQQSLDKNIKSGLLWMMKYITDNYAELSEKVTTDLAAIEEKRVKERALRAERIRLAKEDRKKHEATETDAKDKDSDEEDMVCSPFKPIKQAFSADQSIDSVDSIPQSTPDKTKKSKKDKQKKKRKGNKVGPIHSNEGSQMSLQSNESTNQNIEQDNKLSPLNPSSSLPKLTPDIIGLEKSSLPPITSMDNTSKLSEDVSKAKLSDLIVSKQETGTKSEDNSILIPGMFQNKYVDVDNIENKPVVKVDSLHTIKIDRSKFIQNVPS